MGPMNTRKGGLKKAKTNDFFAHNSNSMETSRCRNSVADHQIATTFCTCHDSTAVVTCTKFCSDHGIRVEVRVKGNFHRILIAMEKPLVKRCRILYPRKWHSLASTDVYLFCISPWQKIQLTSPNFPSSGKWHVHEANYYHRPDVATQQTRHAIMTSLVRQNDVILRNYVKVTSFDVITTLLLRHVFSGNTSK